MAATDPAPMSRAVAVLYAIGSPLMFIALVFVPAGRIDWLPGWVFIGIVTAVFVTSAMVLKWVNPVMYRARSRFQPGTKRWDLVLVPIILAAIVLEVPLATLDSGQMSWSAVPIWMVIFGYFLLTGGIAVTTWAQAVNPFFEPGVGIQREPGQRVVSS
jgi:protein-S-isoprenylcysteine O-methyltransferase Ste14